jgi:hypothetical protein
MANFSISNLVKAQAILAERFTQPEMRSSAAPVTLLGRRNNDMLLPSHSVLRTREERPIEAYLFKRTKRTPGSSRVYNHTGDRGDSIALNLNWSTISDKFSISLKQLDNNVFSFDQALANLIQNAAININDAIEELLVTYLVAQRTQANAATKGGTFNATNYAFEISTANKSQFFQYIGSMMRQNDYRGAYDLVADPLIYASAQFLASQGTMNATNYGFQFSGLNIAESIKLDDANYANGVGLVIPENQFGVLDWIPKQNREGSGDYNSYVGGYGSMVDPMGSGMTFAVHGYQQRADTSTLNGDTQDVVMEFELSVDISPLVAPLSTAPESVVFEVAQV